MGNNKRESQFGTERAKTAGKKDGRSFLIASKININPDHSLISRIMNGSSVRKKSPHWVSNCSERQPE
jgi:hypothetical protein